MSFSTLKAYRIGEEFTAFECAKHYSITTFNQVTQDNYYDVVKPGEFIIVDNKHFRVIVMTPEEFKSAFGAKKGK